MDGEDKTTGAFSERCFAGELKSEHERIAVSFFAKAGTDGEIEFRFEPFPRSAEAVALERRWAETRGKFELYTLTGVADDGTTFESTEVLFTSLGRRWEEGDGHTYQPAAKYQTATLRFPLAQPVDQPIVRLWVKGFECFPEVRASCPRGEVVMSGVARLSDPDTITGVIEVTAKDTPLDASEWTAAAEELAWHIRSIMSFACSVTLRAPLTDVLVGDTSVVSCRSQTRQVRPALQTFQKLNLQPIFDAAVRSHFDPHPDIQGLGMAIEWMAQDSIYNEIRLFGAMTALEHLLDANLSEKDKYIFPADAFDPVRKALMKALDMLASQSPDEGLGEIQAKLSDLNRRSLRKKLNILLDRWCVATADIGKARISAAVEARNRVVHTGQHRSGDDRNPRLWQHVSVIRELMVRIVLTALRFEGEYATYLDGARYVQFPL